MLRVTSPSYLDPCDGPGVMAHGSQQFCRQDTKQGSRVLLRTLKSLLISQVTSVTASGSLLGTAVNVDLNMYRVPHEHSSLNRQLHLIESVTYQVIL